MYEANMYRSYVLMILFIIPYIINKFIIEGMDSRELLTADCLVLSKKGKKTYFWTLIIVVPKSQWVIFFI